MDGDVSLNVTVTCCNQCDVFFWLVLPNVKSKMKDSAEDTSRVYSLDCIVPSPTLTCVWDVQTYCVALCEGKSRMRRDTHLSIRR